MRAACVVGGLLLLALQGAGCKADKAAKPTPHTGSGTGSGSGSGGHDPHAGLILDAGAPLTVSAACEAAITKAGSSPPTGRAKLIIDGCNVCGDWSPLMRWNTPQGSGGPKRADIEASMLACGGFCNGEAKLKFLGTLDDARGTASRMPWKQLGIACKEKVGAVPDGRYLDGVYFALDRIARAVGAKGGDVATNASQFDIPLPAVGVVGTGPSLPTAPATASFTVAQLQVTVVAGTLSVGTAPYARLTKDGLQVYLGANDYPGKSVKAGELTASLKAVSPDATVMLIAPKGTPAQELVPAVTAINLAKRTAYLAVRAPDSPDGWDVPVALATPLETKGKNALRIADGMTVQQLAEALAKRP